MPAEAAVEKATITVMSAEAHESKIVDGDEFKRGRRRPAPLPPPPVVPPLAPATSDSLGVDYEAIPFTDVLDGKYKNVLAAQIDAGVVGTDPERALQFIERLMLAERNLLDGIERYDDLDPHQLLSRMQAAHREIWQCLERGI